MRTPKVTQSQLFDDLGRIFNGPKIIDITIAKSSFTVLYNMIFDKNKMIKIRISLIRISLNSKWRVFRLYN